MNNFQSLATIKAPEFINLQPLDINPLMIKCDIKVLYLGENINRTYISKDVATEMAKSLRGAPIVGYFKQEKEDFRDHGEKVIVDADGIQFSSMTKPYGFVSPDSKVWFQEFEDTDSRGVSVLRTYLMTQGYLWKGQFEEEVDCLISSGGKPHSMELDEESFDGYWSNIDNSNYEFFIINDAIFSKLCILGDDVEPCFEGSSVTPSTTNYSLDTNMTKTLYTMMKDLQQVLEGGNTVEDEKTLEQAVEEAKEEATQEEATPAVENEEAGSTTEEPSVKTVEAEPAAVVEEKNSEIEDNSVEMPTENIEVNIEGASSEYAKTEDDKEDKEEKSEDSEEEKKDEEESKKYSMLQQTYEALKADYEILAKEVAELREFKLNEENKAKDSLISEFYMLSDSDKQDVIANKSKYTLDEIKSKLAVICYDKKISYSADSQEEYVGTTVNVAQVDSTVPAWLEAVDRHIENDK